MIKTIIGITVFLLGYSLGTLQANFIARNNLIRTIEGMECRSYNGTEKHMWTNSLGQLRFWIGDYTCNFNNLQK
jgi:hypothetical protein